MYIYIYKYVAALHGNVQRSLQCSASQAGSASPLAMRCRRRIFPVVRFRWRPVVSDAKVTSKSYLPGGEAQHWKMGEKWIENGVKLSEME